MLRQGCAVAAVVALFACAAPRYAYVPVGVGLTSADVSGAPAALYEMPPGSRHGDVRVAMLGVTPLKPKGVEDSTLPAIHVALAATNRSDEPWTVDPAEVRVAVATHHGRDDIYATTIDLAHARTVEVPARSVGVIDLYFPLPIQLHKQSELPSFDVFWTVHVGGRAITQRTPFQRMRAATPPLEPRDLRGPSGIDTHEPLPGSEPPDRRHTLPLDEE